MRRQDPHFPAADYLAIRAGCALCYEVSQPTPILLLFKPQTDEKHILVEENLAFGNGMPVEEFKDIFGNTTYRASLVPGLNEYRHDAVFLVHKELDNAGLSTDFTPVQHLPPEVLRFILPSRYCDSDKLFEFAQQRFGHLPPGPAQAKAVCEWVHSHIAYRYGCGDPSLSAWDIVQRGHGVCRDFAHVMIALCRALDLPARYVAGHVPYLGQAEGDIGVDFHAYCEVFLGGAWHTFDPRFNTRRTGRLHIARGLDAVDAAFATIFGDAVQVHFRVWAYQVEQTHGQLEEAVAISPDGQGSILVHPA
jgi:transglutaminase-like putative cysteine protease